MSFFKKMCWWGSNTVSPDKEFTMVLGEGLDGKREYQEKRSRYGTAHERMTSPGRELLREHILTPSSKQMKPKFNGTKGIRSRRSSGRIVVEEVEITSKDGKKRTEIRQSSYISDSQDDDGVTQKNGHKNGSIEESKYREESKSGNFEGNIDFAEAFNRLDRFTEVQAPKIGVDQGVIYCVGPISKYIESPARLPIDEIGNPDKISVVKIAWGYGHMLVLLENGAVYVVGDNSRGQLGLNPKKFPMVEDKLMLHTKLQKNYEVIDVGCCSNNSVFLVRDIHRTDQHRKILTCGYHGWLGVRDLNEDEFRFQDVKIPELDDFDKIEFLICKFNSCAVLDSDSNLYYWGDDFDGFRKRVPEKKNYFEKRIVDLSFGLRHAIMLLEDGGIYILGDGKIWYQLMFLNLIVDNLGGFGEFSSKAQIADPSVPMKLRYFSENDIQIVKVEAGARHSLFLDSEGKVYGWEVFLAGSALSRPGRSTKSE